MDGIEVERRMSCQGVTPSGSESERASMDGMEL